MKTTLLSIAIGASLVSCAKKDSKVPDLASSFDDTPRSTKEPAAASTSTPVASGSATAMALDEGKLDKADVARAAAIESARNAGILGSVSGGGAYSLVAPSSPAHVAAGEWDDNANYRDYLGYLAKTNQAELDSRNRQFIVVTDADGKPVPDCAIRIGDVRLTTGAAGRALLFPHAYGLTSKLSAQIACGKQQATASIDPTKTDAITTVRLASPRALPSRRAVDVAFVLDTTGSMGEEIDAVKATIGTVAQKLQAQQVDVRFAMIAYKDRVDSEVMHAYPFTSDAAAFAASVKGVTADGGGDYPEDMQAALQAGVDGLDWNAEAVARVAVVIADAPPHLDYKDEHSYAETAKHAVARGIKLYTVAASGMDDLGQAVMRQLSQFTGATNLFVLRGGAGPQSTGGGDPKSSCGDTHTSYTSGNLDALILAKLIGELRAVDADPMRIAGVGQDENAKPCDKRVQIAVE